LLIATKSDDTNSQAFSLSRSQLIPAAMLLTKMLQQDSPLSRCKLKASESVNDSVEKAPMLSCDGYLDDALSCTSILHLPECNQKFMSLRERARRVEFDPNVVIRLIKHRKCIIQRSLDDRWYFLEEHRPSLLGNKKIESRNTEKDVESRTRRKKRRKTKPAAQQVLAQQAKQREQGFVNPESLADLSAKRSLKSIICAHTLAVEDAQEASKYLQDETNEFEDILL
jgi:hypothetical protein